MIKSISLDNLTFALPPTYCDNVDYVASVQQKGGKPAELNRRTVGYLACAVLLDDWTAN